MLMIIAYARPLLGLWEFTLAGACCFEVETAHAKPQFSVFGHCYNKILWLLVLNYGFAVCGLGLVAYLLHIGARNLLH